MKTLKAIWLPVGIVLLLSILLSACNQEQFAHNPVGTSAPTHTAATDSSNNIDHSQSMVSTDESTASTIDEITAPTEEVTESTEPVTQPTEPAPMEPEETKAHEHEYAVVDTVKPDCIQNGHKTHVCACGDSYTETIYARGYHTWGEWKVTQEATTSREGEQVRKCVDCDDSQSESIAKLPQEETTPLTEPPHTHNYSGTVIDPTCDDVGYTVHTCGCGNSYTDCETPALGHCYTKTVVEPTIESEGYTEYICAGCGHTYRDNYTEKLPVPVEPPFNEDTGCDLCDAKCIITVIPPTPEANGYTLFECPACGYSVRRHSTPYGHTHDYCLVEVCEPTCVNSGYSFYACDCGDACIADVVDALGHDFSEDNICANCGFTEESLYTLDYEDAMAYGNQYAVDTYGWYIDLELNFDNAGYNFPGAGSKAGIIERGGQQDLYRLVRKEIDGLYDSLINRGLTGKAYVNCHVCEDEDGIVLVYVFYG